MPYIKGGLARSEYMPHAASTPDDAGGLNYQISCLLVEYVEQNGMRYNILDDCTGACENAAAEFRRRVMAPYENVKIAKNGDVYDSLLAMLPES